MIAFVLYKSKLASKQAYFLHLYFFQIKYYYLLMKLPKWAITVTPLSKIVALIIFIAFPILTFWLGMQYQNLLNVKNQNNKIDNAQKQNSALIANPASVYCENQGGRSKIITDRDGSQRGDCIFTDGRKCDEWQFFRTGVCKR